LILSNVRQKNSGLNFMWYLQHITALFCISVVRRSLSAPHCPRTTNAKENRSFDLFE